MQFDLPDMLKQRPKQFWGMLKNKEREKTDLSTKAFKKFNESIFYDQAIPPDEYTPLTDASQNYITQEELSTILQHHFKANKSSGLSKMPLQILKHMGKLGTACMADFLNASAID
jgi:hypothetical protein